VDSDRSVAGENRFYIAEHFLGVFMLNSAGEAVLYELRPKDLSSLVESLWIRNEGKLDDVYARFVERLKSSEEYRKLLLWLRSLKLLEHLLLKGLTYL